MPKKQLSNLGYLMEMLSISAKELSLAINIDQTSVSRWRTGIRKPPVDMPYFHVIVNYLIQKNMDIGGGLLEDFFGSVYPTQRQSVKDDLPKHIRNYILNIPVEQTSSTDVDTLPNYANSYMSVAKQVGVEGRHSMVITLLESAEKLTAPSVIKIFETEQLGWISNNMNFTVTFYQKLKKVLDLGHKVEFIFQTLDTSYLDIELQYVFLELAFHENLNIYLYSSKANIAHVCSIYSLSRRLTVVGYCFDNDFKNMLSCMYADRQFIEAHERLWEKYKLSSPIVTLATKKFEFEKIINKIKALRLREGSYFHMGKALSTATMSKELLSEILEGNQLTKEQKRLCFEFYHLLRESIESSETDHMSGFYYVLDEISAPLNFPTITNYILSAITGKVVQMSKEQYQRHFRDTAELLQRDSRYRIILYYDTLPASLPVSTPLLIWHKSECWMAVINTDDYSGKIKFLFGDNLKVMNALPIKFRDIYDRIPDYKKDNAYVAELFIKIANGDGV